MFGITGEEDEQPARRSAAEPVSLGNLTPPRRRETHREVLWLLQ